jgi:ATP-dependent DNA ligase
MKKTYPTLYSKDSTGKIRIWLQEQNGANYRTIAGVKDSENLVYSDWSVAEPKNTGKKNATSAEEQAVSEIEAKYKKQRKTGYFDSIKDVDTVQYVEPMLAKNYNNYSEKIDFSKELWGIQCKFNGNRCIATKDGLFTRKGEKYVNVKHIEESLKSFFVNHPLAVLDGELANYELRQELNELNKLIRRTVNITPEDVENSKKMVKYYIYDGYGFESCGQQIPYKTRKHWIDNNVINKYKYIEEVKTYPVKNRSDLDKQYNIFVQDGEEGGILRKLDEGYENKRSKYLLKIKPEDDAEAILINIQDGDGNWKGAATIATLLWKGQQFDAMFKGTYEKRAVILKNKKDWIDKEVTFLYNGLTGLGTPNFARIDISNCFKK